MVLAGPVPLRVGVGVGVHVRGRDWGVEKGWGAWMKGAVSAAGDARRWQQQRPRKTVSLICGCVQARAAVGMLYALACTYVYVCIRDVCVKCGWRVYIRVGAFLRPVAGCKYKSSN